MSQEVDLVQDLISERETNTTVDYMELLLEVKPHSFWIFVEGNDTVFYRTHVFRVFGRRPDSLPCYGKLGVLKLRDLIEQKRELIPDFWENVITLYFVDKDHDDYCSHFDSPPDEVFVTDVYSVENYLVCEEVLLNLLEDALYFKDVKDQAHVRAVREQFPKVTKQFNQALSEFHSLLFPLSQWLILYKRKHRGKRTPREIKPKVAITWSNQSFEIDVKYPELNQLDVQFELDSVVREQEMLSLDHLRSIDPKQYTRGKYEAEFFLQFFRAAYTYLKMHLKSGDLTVRDQLLSAKQFVLMISEKRLTTPKSLSSYLEKRQAKLQ